MTLEFEGVKLYTTLEVSQKLRITPQTVREYIKRKRLQGQRVGKTFLIPEPSLKEFLKIEKNHVY